MSWNPATYNKFKSERFTPFFDLLALVKVKEGLSVIDLGCGTGELTRKLADALPQSTVLGIDSSAEMLKDSKAFENDSVKFECKSIEEQLKTKQKWDVVFSNAAIQWTDNHEKLIPQLISITKPGGQLAIQMPDQHSNISNILLNELAAEEPYKTALNNWTRVSPVLPIDNYAQLFFENGSTSMTVYEKIYPLILQDTDALFDWVSGTALIPYTERLQGKIKENFISEYKKRLKSSFKSIPVFYPFKRLILEATF